MDTGFFLGLIKEALHVMNEVLVGVVRRELRLHRFLRVGTKLLVRPIEITYQAWSRNEEGCRNINSIEKVGWAKREKWEVNIN